MTDGELRLEVVAAEDLPERAAQWVADHLWSAVAAQGVAHLALSGGTTPSAMFRSLSTLRLPWDRVHLWQVDERVAPDGSPDRNATSLQRWLVEAVGLAAGQVHLMDVEADDLHGAASRYGAELRRHSGGVLDVVHLGLGDDGHTASWAPGDEAVLHSTDDVAVSGVFRGFVRLTLTPACVNRARLRMVLASGSTKREAVAALRSGGSSLPLGVLRRDATVVLVDPPAGA